MTDKIFDLEEIKALVEGKTHNNEELHQYTDEDKEIQEQILKANKDGIDLAPYLELNLHPAQLRQIRLGMVKQISVELYASEQYNWKQMKEIRKGLMKHLNIMPYYNPLFSAEQMHEIRLGLEDDIDVSSYAKLIYSTSDMKSKRKALLAEYIENANLEERIDIDDQTGVKIRLSADRLKAFITIPKDEQEQITLEYLVEQLKKRDIIYGIHMSVLEKLVQKKGWGIEVLVAEGRNFIKGEPGKYQFFFDTNRSTEPLQLPDGSVEYHIERYYEKVKAGQKIAEYIPPKVGGNGMTVTGIKLVDKISNNKEILTGSGFKLLEDGVTYVSEKDGVIKYNDHKIEITEMLAIEGDVNLSTGDINYTGSIMISGSVRDGMTVKAGKDIIILGCVESAHLIAGEDVYIKKGVIEKEKGRIIAGGSIRGAFFENANLSAKKQIEANYFFRCNLFAEESIIARGNKGRIIGGHAQAVLSIQSRYIGNIAQLGAVIEIGKTKSFTDDWSAKLKRKESLKGEIELLSSGEGKIRSVESKSRDNNRLLNQILTAKAMKERDLSKLDMQIKKMEEQMKNTQHSYLLVSGTLFSGNRIIINGVQMMISEDRNNVRITQNKKSLVIN